MAEGGKVEIAATCGMVAEYDFFSIGVEMLISGFSGRMNFGCAGISIQASVGV